MTALDDDGTQKQYQTKMMPYIVALRGDALFWIYLQSVKAFEHEDKPKPRKGCKNTGGGMVVAVLRLVPCYCRQQQAATGKEKRRWRR